VDRHFAIIATFSPLEHIADEGHSGTMSTAKDVSDTEIELDRVGYHNYDLCDEPTLPSLVRLLRPYRTFVPGATSDFDANGSRANGLPHSWGAYSLAIASLLKSRFSEDRSRIKLHSGRDVSKDGDERTEAPSPCDAGPVAPPAAGLGHSIATMAIGAAGLFLWPMVISLPCLRPRSCRFIQSPLCVFSIEF